MPFNDMKIKVYNFNADYLNDVLFLHIREPNEMNDILCYLKEKELTINQANEQGQILLSREISSLEMKISNTINLLIEMPSDKLKEKLSELESRQKQLIYELERAEASMITGAKLEKYLIRAENFDELIREEKQIFVKKAIKKITAYKDGNFEISTTYGEVVDKDVYKHGF